MQRNPGVAAAALVILGLLAGTGASPAADGKDSPEAKARIHQLADRYRQWLDDVEMLISRPERAAFLALEKDYQRDGFIHRFWEARNPYPGSSRNAFKEKWLARLEQAREQYGTLNDDRARMHVLHGPPQSVKTTDCGMLLWPLEIWHSYSGDNVYRGLELLFFQRGAGGPYRLWHYGDGYQELVSMFNFDSAIHYHLDEFAKTLHRYCHGDAEEVLHVVLQVQHQQESHTHDLLDAAPLPRDREWLDTFRSVSTDLPAGAGKLAARLEVRFPRRDRDHTLGNRTLVQGMVAVPLAAASPAQLGEHRAYNFILSGEVLRGTELFESFRYRFDLPAAGLAGDALPLVFERSLWPGDYTLILRVEDLHSHRDFREERPLEVPALEEEPGTVSAAGGGAAAPPGGQPSGAVGPSAGPIAAARGGGFGATVDAARGTLAEDAPTLKIVPPDGELKAGPLRIDAEATGEAVRKVTFFLDGKEMLSRARPPYSVELNLGELPRTREVRAVAYDAGGQVVAADTLQLNPPRQRLAVHLIEPRPGTSHRGRLEARAEVRLPDGASLDRLELYLGDERVATLFQPPYALAVPLPAHAGAGFVRAVAYLTDGRTAEDLVVINAPDVAERIEVRLVELYSSVLDASGRPVKDLQQADFKVFELGKEQPLLRFERVRDLPLHLLFAVDTSASMARSLPQVQTAVLSFVERTLKPQDQAALVTFSDSPILRAPFTADVKSLAGALAGLNAERGTALWDSLIYALSYMKGAAGQSALLLFTDAGDHLSRLPFEEALEFARRSGIVIYTVGMQVPRLDLPERNRLSRLASETGGRSFFIDTAAELDAVAASIEEELRSRYLLAYQSQNPPRSGEYRPVVVHVAGPGRQVKTLRGYYP
jgi:VWFA-related protein